MTNDLLSDEIARLIEPIAWTALGMMDTPVYENRRAASLEKAARILRLAEARIIERCADEQPSTAENPNEDAYQRGRFDGIMEFGKRIRALALSPLAKETT